MSVSYDQKKEIITQGYKSLCCRRALLSGILFAKGQIDVNRIIISLEKEEYADFTTKLINEFYGKEAEVYRLSVGGRSIKIAFNSPSATKYISKINSLQEACLSDLIVQKCSGCLSSFLRGVFLASGRLADPKKQFSLEFSLGERSYAFAKILSDMSLPPKISRKSSGTLVYYHKADEIEDFYGYAGLNKLVFDIIETKINSLARRESQRYLNCVTNNLDRMAAVSERQIGIIARLEELQLLSSLPEELEETARMKLRYPDLPLSALAAQMTPAISKSGLSHRLKKIEELGAKLLKLSDDT